MELADRFDKSIGCFWHATHQQSYRELVRLEEALWVEALPAETGRSRKRQFRRWAARMTATWHFLDMHYC